MQLEKHPSPKPWKRQPRRPRWLLPHEASIMSCNQIVVLSEFFSWPLFLTPEIAVRWECFVCLHGVSNGREAEARIPASSVYLAPFPQLGAAARARAGSSCQAWGQVCLEAQRVKVVSWEVPWTVKQAVRKRGGLVAGTLLLGSQWLSPVEGYWGFRRWRPMGSRVPHSTHNTLHQVGFRGSFSTALPSPQNGSGVQILF